MGTALRERHCLISKWLWGDFLLTRFSGSGFTSVCILNIDPGTGGLTHTWPQRPPMSPFIMEAQECRRQCQCGFSTRTTILRALFLDSSTEHEAVGMEALRCFNRRLNFFQWFGPFNSIILGRFSPIYQKRIFYIRDISWTSCSSFSMQKIHPFLCPVWVMMHS